MANYFHLFIVSTVLTIFAIVPNTNAQEKPVTNVCLGCLCEAISGCNQTAMCTGGVCGLFRITWAYWSDGGKPTINNESPDSEQAYPNCVNDPYCAAAAIQNYMTKFGQDCNNDNAIDCYDYAAIHKLGGYGCKGDVGYKYQTDLTNCLTSFSNIDVRNNA